MLKELRNLDFPGSKEAIIFFLHTLVKYGELSSKDLYVLCYSLSSYRIDINQMIDYCVYFDFIIYDKFIKINPEVIPYTATSDQLNSYVVEKTVEKLFLEGILTSQMFSFDIKKKLYLFNNEKLALEYSTIRNVLVSQGVFIRLRLQKRTLFYIAENYEIIIAKFCSIYKRKHSLEELKKRQEENEIAGEKAEKYTFSYEQHRIKGKNADKIKKISNIDVSAGYDILSFQDENSTTFDRFIEVKAIAENISFYWSRNELEVAKLLGENYYLYLIELRKINNINYMPIIIRNPALTIMKSTDWLIESESYHIRKVLQ